MPNSNGVYDIAWNFLLELEARRRPDPSRPLIFVAHSLGGIVVKEMLRRSSGFLLDRQAHLRAISDATIGIIFFGTPHCGADPRRLLQTVAETVAKVLGFGANQRIVDALLPTSERLRELRDEFGPMAQAHNWVIHSFQESVGIRALGGRKVVEDASSCINLPGVETSQHIGRDHMDICRFTGPADPEYAKVRAALDRLIAQSSPGMRACGQDSAPDVQVTTEQREWILKSLQFERVDFRRAAIKAAHLKTCKWLLKDPVYTHWLDVTKLDQHHGFLWIKGKPGTGKSTLMKFALSNTQKSRRDRIVVSFFFNARGQHLEKSTQGMYRSLLAQLLEQIPWQKEAHQALTSMCRSFTGCQDSWSIESLKEIFQQIILGLGKRSVVCFIDALDECDEDEIRDMISFFETLSDLVIESNIQFEVCLASRHYPQISIRRGQTLVLETHLGHSEDIVSYINSELKIGDGALAQQIRTDLQEKARSVFMWVVLVVQILNKEYVGGRVHMLRKKLAELPGDLHGLFRELLTRDQRNMPELIRCVEWVLFSTRPLNPSELYHAILFKEAADELSSLAPCEITKDVQLRYILDTSKGLTEVVSSKKLGYDVVQFIHESVRDFFLKEGGLAALWPELGTNFRGLSQERLKQSCVKYLALDLPVFPDLREQGRQPETPLLSWKPNLRRDVVLQSLPFLRYAVQNVFNHADQAQSLGIDQTSFLANFPRKKWISLFNLFEEKKTRRYKSEEASLLYILANADVQHLIKILPDNHLYLREEGERYGVPLFAAMATESCRAIQAFLDIEIASHPNMDVLVKLRDRYLAQGEKRPRLSRTFVFHKHRPVQNILEYMPSYDKILQGFFFIAQRPRLLLSPPSYYLGTTQDTFEEKLCLTLGFNQNRPEGYNEAILNALLALHRAKDGLKERVAYWALVLGCDKLVQQLTDGLTLERHCHEFCLDFVQDKNCLKVRVLKEAVKKAVKKTVKEPFTESCRFGDLAILLTSLVSLQLEELFEKFLMPTEADENSSYTVESLRPALREAYKASVEMLLTAIKAAIDVRILRFSWAAASAGNIPALEAFLAAGCFNPSDQVDSLHRELNRAGKPEVVEFILSVWRAGLGGSTVQRQAALRAARVVGYTKVVELLSTADEKVERQGR